MNKPIISKFNRVVIALSLSAVLLGGCASLGNPTTEVSASAAPKVEAVSGVVAEGHIAPRDFTGIAFNSGGKVAEVWVKEGDEVQAGQALARLIDREPFQAALSQAQLEQLNAQQSLDQINRKAGIARSQTQDQVLAAQKSVLDAQQAVDELNTQEYEQKIDDAWVKVQEANDDLKDAQEEVDKYSNLAKDNQTRKDAEKKLEDARKTYDDAVREHSLLVNDLDQARANLEKADAQLAEAQREKGARRDGPDVDDLALAQARLKNATAQVAAAQTAMDDLEISAPYAGTIVELRISANEQVVPGQAVIVLADLSELYVETSDLTETDVVKIEPGQTVKIVPDALPDVVLNGKVDSIGRSFKEKAGDIVYTVRLRLEDSDPRLRWGMTVNTTFEK